MTAAYEFPARPVMTAVEVAEAYGITPNHAYHLAKTKVLPSIRLGRTVRFPTSAIKQQLLGAKTETPNSAPTEPGIR